MRIYSESNNYILYHGDMLNMAETIKPNTIDAAIDYYEGTHTEDEFQEFRTGVTGN